MANDNLRVVSLVERAVLETMLERIAVISTPRVVTQSGPKAVDGFRLGILAACTVLKDALKEADDAADV